MPWTDVTRVEYRRRTARHPSDLTDGEWALIGPLLPPAKPGGRPRMTDLRDVMDAILHVASSGCRWRMLPRCFPPPSTVQYHFHDWRNGGLWLSINHLPVMSARELEGQQASPGAGVIDSQSVKTAEGGGVRGHDAGKRIAGRKRHVITDTLGCMLFIIVHGAAIQDRDGAVDLMKAIRCRHPWLRHPFADGGHAGDKLRDALLGHGQWTIDIIGRSDTAEGFEIPPRRWVVERTFAWLGRCRRLAEDWERSIEGPTAWATIAHIRTLTRRLARYCYD